MNDNKAIQLSLLHQEFKEIRRTYHNNVEVFSLVDVMAQFTDLDTPPHILWNRTRNRLEKDGFELVQNVYRLKLEATDGKERYTDVADRETVLRIIQSIPSKKAEPIRLWMAALAEDNIKSMEQARRDKAIGNAERAGYGDHPQVQWLKDRNDNIKVFESLKKTIARVTANPQWGRVLNAEYEAMFGELASTLKVILDVKNPRDGLPSLQLTALTFAERTLQATLDRQGYLSDEQLLVIIRETVEPLGDYLRDVCLKMGIHHVTGQALLARYE